MTDVTTTTEMTNPSRLEWLRANLPAGWGAAATVGGAWIVLIIASGLHRPDFLSHQTVLAISFTMVIVGVLAVAQALVGISGGIIDLSQPAALTLSASIVAKLLDMGVPIAITVVAGILYVGQLGSTSNFTGTGLEFQVYAAMMIGGYSIMRGGVGNPIGGALGLLVVAGTANILDVQAISPYYTNIIIGVLLLAAVLLDRLRGGDSYE